MNTIIGKKLKNRKRKIKRRTRRRNWEDQHRQMLSGSNIHYDFDGRNKGVANGGIGIIHTVSGGSADQAERGSLISARTEREASESQLKDYDPIHELRPAWETQVYQNKSWLELVANGGLAQEQQKWDIAPLWAFIWRGGETYL